MPTDARDPQAWFDIAAKDLGRAHRRFAEGDIGDCLFRLQQCAEKAMKGKLLSLGWKLQKTHELGLLLLELKSKQLDCSWFETAADVLETEYISDRYPGFVDQPPDTATLRGFIVDTVKLFESLTNRKYNGHPLPPEQPARQQEAGT